MKRLYYKVLMFVYRKIVFRGRKHNFFGQKYSLEFRKLNIIQSTYSILYLRHGYTTLMRVIDWYPHTPPPLLSEINRIQRALHIKHGAWVHEVRKENVSGLTWKNQQVELFIWAA